MLVRLLPYILTMDRISKKWFSEPGPYQCLELYMRWNVNVNMSMSISGPRLWKACCLLPAAKGSTILFHHNWSNFFFFFCYEGIVHFPEQHCWPSNCRERVRSFWIGLIHAPFGSPRLLVPNSLLSYLTLPGWVSRHCLAPAIVRAKQQMINLTPFAFNLSAIICTPHYSYE